MKRYWQAFVFEHLALLVDGGMPLHRAMEMVSIDIEEQSLATLLEQGAIKVRAGQPLDTIPELKRLMPDGMIGLIALSTDSSELGKKFQVIAQACESSAEPLNDDFRMNMGPIHVVLKLAVFLVCLGTVLRINIQVFESMFRTLGAPLPLATEICLAINNGVGGIWVPMALLLIMVTALVWWMHRAAKHSRIAAWFMWYLPPFSFYNRQNYIVLMIEYMVIGLKLKIDWSTVFTCMATHVSNPVWNAKTKKLAENLGQGESLISALESARIPLKGFASTFTRIETAEWTHLLLEFKESLIAECRLKYRLITKRFSLAVFVGVIMLTGFIVISMYMPMFSLIGELSK